MQLSLARAITSLTLSDGSKVKFDNIHLNGKYDFFELLLFALLRLTDLKSFTDGHHAICYHNSSYGKNALIVF